MMLDYLLAFSILLLCRAICVISYITKLLSFLLLLFFLANVMSCFQLTCSYR